MKYPLDILGDVPVKVADFYVLNDFMVLDMAKAAYTRLGRPCLATSDCKIDLKGGWLTFDVGKCHAEFTLFEDRNFSHSHLLAKKYRFLMRLRHLMICVILTLYA